MMPRLETLLRIEDKLVHNLPRVLGSSQTGGIRQRQREEEAVAGNNRTEDVGHACDVFFLLLCLSLSSFSIL